MTRQAFSCTLLFALLIAGPSGFAQITGDLVILSPRVGEYIDAAESEFFHVFQSVKGLQRAHVIVTRDSLLYVIFEIENPPSPPKTEYIQYSPTLLNVIAEKIEHIEGLTDGTYVMGTQPAILTTIHGTSPAVRVPTLAPRRPTASEERYRRNLEDVLPLAGPVVPRSTRYPQFGMTAGVSTYNPDLSELPSLITSVEDYYRQTGYPIRYLVPDDDPGMVLLFSVSVVLSPSFEMSLDVAYQEGLLTVKTAAIGARYFPALLHFFDGLRGFLTAGMQISSYSISSHLNYGDRIGPDDALGRYMILARMSIAGSERRVVPLLGGGIEFGHTGGNPIGLSVFAKYLLGPQLIVSSRTGSCAIQTGGAMFGLSLTLYF